MSFVRTWLALLLTATAACSAPDEGVAPNVVLIVGDDLAYVDLGFMGSAQVRTPNLDRLAREGMTFVRGYSTASVCKPAMRTLLTGMDPMRVSLGTREARWLGESPEPHLPTVPELLAPHGYASYQAGKFWGQTYDEGWEGAGFTAGMGWTQHGRFRHSDLGRPSIQGPLDFIDANLDRPFFLWFAPMLPHVPFDAPEEFVELYRDSQLSDGERAYFANVSRFDSAVGRLVDHLEKRGIASNTLVIYLNDNGWDRRRFGLGTRDGPRGKGTIYDLGFRTPIVFWGPGRVRAGVVHRDLVSILDVPPTILDAAGVPPREAMHGRSLLGALDGGRVAGRFAVLGWLNPNRIFKQNVQDQALFVRTDRWRYVAVPALERRALYDIERDPFEHRDVIASHPDVARELEERIAPFVAKVMAANPSNARTEPVD